MPAHEQADPDLFRQSDAVEVRRVTNRGKGGRGVFARRAIGKEEVFERVPVILLPHSQVFGADPVALRAARISWYVFEWLKTKRGYVALSLGYGSIYNHSETPNAAYEMSMPDVMAFHALSDIPAGAEIFINYRGTGGHASKNLCFEPSADTAGPADGASTAIANGVDNCDR
jgi:hypothetical protein